MLGRVVEFVIAMMGSKFPDIHRFMITSPLDVGKNRLPEI